MDVRPAPTARPLAAAPGVGAATVGETVVTGITLDSRQVRPGDLYAALPGASTHGGLFVAQAIGAGANAILTDPDGASLIGRVAVPVVVVPDPRARLGEISAWVYGYPAHQLVTLGVTGTNGKTTMTYLLEAALHHLGQDTGLIGTTGVHVAGETLSSPRTTPEAPDVHALLAVMVERGATAVAMEVSSHALALGRVDGITFDVALFTNLSQDHLDFHHTMAGYFATKAMLFTPARARHAVICVDDVWGRRLSATTNLPTATYGVVEPGDWLLRDPEVLPTGAWRATVVAPDGAETPISSPLAGSFNMANALGAVATAAVVAPASLPMIADGVSRCPGVPGRMEPIPAPDFGVYVDYAHTPDAVARVIAAVRSFGSGRVLVALGCGGDRDAGKRPEMGRVASVGADVVVVTDDNPRSEDPAVIRQAVLAGARSGSAEVLEIGDRRAAIAHVIDRARPGDVVLILGKGHEPGQEVAGVVTPFDDRIEAAVAIDRQTR